MAKTTAELRQMINSRRTANAEELSKKGKLTARMRMDIIFDADTFVEVGTYIGDGDETNENGYCPVITGYGSVGGLLVFAFSQDYSRMNGAVGKAHAKKICNIINMALEANAPLIGVFDSAGANIDEGSDALAACGKIMKAVSVTCASIPTIAVIAGPCGGASAVTASMFDYIITAKKTGSLYMVPSSVLTDKTLGKPEKLSETGVSSITTEDEASACEAAAKLCSYFTSDLPSEDTANRDFDSSLLSGDEYDIHGVISSLFDAGSFTELYAERAPQMTVGLASMNSRVCGIIANNPSFKGGKLCPGAAEKAVKLMRACDKLSIPVVTLVDGVGVGTTDKIEEGGISAKLADMVYEYSASSSRKVTVILGKAYGSAFTVMGSKSIGADIVFALDRAVISPLNPETAVEFLGEVKDEAKAKETAKAWADKYASPLEAARKGNVDDIIESAELRKRISAALEMLA